MNKKIILLTIVMTTIAATLNLIIKVYDLVSYKGIMRLVTVLGVVVFIIGVVLLVLKKDKSIIITTSIFLVILLISSYMSTFIINYQHQGVFTIGTQIAVTLNNYYKVNNSYPQTLEELVPKYIDSVPKIKTTYYNGDFSYYVQEGGQSYYLGFEQYYFDGNGWIEKE